MIVKENLNFKRGGESKKSLNIGARREIYPPFDDIDRWPGGLYLLNRWNGLNLLRAEKEDGALKFNAISVLFPRISEHWSRILEEEPEQVTLMSIRDYDWLDSNSLTWDNLVRFILGNQEIISIKKVG